MTTKAEIMNQIMTRQGSGCWAKGNDGHIFIGTQKNIYIEHIPRQNLLSCNSWFLIILRNKDKTLILETIGLLSYEQLKIVVAFVNGAESEDVKPAQKHVKRYDKNRCFVVNYDGNYSANY